MKTDSLDKSEVISEWWQSVRQQIDAYEKSLFHDAAELAMKSLRFPEIKEVQTKALSAIARYDTARGLLETIQRSLPA